MPVLRAIVFLEAVSGWRVAVLAIGLSSRNSPETMAAYPAGKVALLHPDQSPVSEHGGLSWLAFAAQTVTAVTLLCLGDGEAATGGGRHRGRVTPACSSREPFDTPWAQARRGMYVGYPTKFQDFQSMSGNDTPAKTPAL